MKAAGVGPCWRLMLQGRIRAFPSVDVVGSANQLLALFFSCVDEAAAPGRELRGDEYGEVLHACGNAGKVQVWTQPSLSFKDINIP